MSNSTTNSVSSGGGSGASLNQAQSTGSNWNVGTPELMNSSQSQLALALAGIAGKYGDQVFNWAQNSLGPNTAMTDNAVQNYMNSANTQYAGAQSMMNQYGNVYMPEAANLANQAAQYNSGARQQVNAGQAIANTMQGNNASLTQAKQHLIESGVNPGSPAYQELMSSAATGAGAAGAAAGTNAAQATQQEGLNLENQSLQLGNQLPGASANAANAGNTAVSGAVGATNANTNTGANALGVANNYYNTAIGLKYPGIGQATSGGGTNQSTSFGQSANSSANQSVTHAQSSPSNSSQSGSGSGPPTYTTTPNPSPPNTAGFMPGAGSGYSGGGGGGGYRRGGAVRAIPALAMGGAAPAPVPFDARGGAIPISGDQAVGGPTTGGFVSRALSPSNGTQTDDIPARLNANEFVIPRDVTAWKGQEHFQKLIAQSRTALAKAAARPTVQQGPR